MNQWQNFVHIIETQKEIRKSLVHTLGYTDIAKGCYKLLNQVRNKTIDIERLKIIAPLLSLDPDELIDDYQETKRIIAREQKLLKQIESLINQIQQRDNFKPYIYIESSEKRPTQITFAGLLGGGMKYIYKLPGHILDLSKSDQINLVKDIILDNYKSKEGNCLFFGKIIGYIYFPEFNRGIKFSVTGDVIDEYIPHISEAISGVYYKGKKIPLQLK